jgi:hypothetical protein
MRGAFGVALVLQRSSAELCWIARSRRTAYTADMVLGRQMVQDCVPRLDE